MLRASHHVLISIMEPAPLASSANQHTFDLSHHGHALVTSTSNFYVLIGQKLTDEIMRKIYAVNVGYLIHEGKYLPSITAMTIISSSDNKTRLAQYRNSTLDLQYFQCKKLLIDFFIMRVLYTRVAEHHG